jgi:hypothetical protein
MGDRFRRPQPCAASSRILSLEVYTPMIPNTRNACRYSIRQALILILLAALLAFSPGVARSPLGQGVSQSHALAIGCQCGH